MRARGMQRHASALRIKSKSTMTLRVLSRNIRWASMLPFGHEGKRSGKEIQRYDYLSETLKLFQYTYMLRCTKIVSLFARFDSILKCLDIAKFKYELRFSQSKLKVESARKLFPTSFSHLTARLLSLYNIS